MEWTCRKSSSCFRSEEKKSILSVKLLPKKAARTLRATLQYLYEKIYSTFWSERNKRGEDPDCSLDRDFKIKKKEVGLLRSAQSSILLTDLVSFLNSFYWNWKSKRLFSNSWRRFCAAIVLSCYR